MRVPLYAVHCPPNGQYTEERLSSELDLVQNPTKSIGIKLTHTRSVPYIRVHFSTKYILA